MSEVDEAIHTLEYCMKHGDKLNAYKPEIPILIRRAKAAFTAEAKLEKVREIAKKHSGTNWHAGINEYREWILEILSIVEESHHAK